MRSTILRLIGVIALTLCLGCSGPPAFEHDVTGEALPWTHEQADNASNKFTFAVFSDLTGGERERVFEIAVAQLNLLRPALIVNVGDLIEGASDDPAALAKEWDWFDERAQRARAPIFYVGGNHDLTGAVLQGVWDERYGRRYYHVRYRDVLFLVLDTEDNTPERMREIKTARDEALRIVAAEGMDAYLETEYASMPEQSTGNIGDEQAAYFRRVLAENADVRWTFLFFHKAPWEREGEQNFDSIEQTMADRVHAFEYVERLCRDYIQLATTGGIQFPNRGPSMDQVTLVTVAGDSVDIAHLRMDGILDKTGRVPLGGDTVCFELAECG